MLDDVRRQALEAVLFLAEEPVSPGLLAEVLECDEPDVLEELAALRERLAGEGRGFVLRDVAGGWRLYTAPEAIPFLERYVLSGRSGRLTQAALETLAVIAYKQPIARHEISDIRGVNADGAVRTLVQRGLVEEVGRDEGPGQAILYGTTSTLLEELGLNRIDELPELAGYLDEVDAPDEPGPEHTRAARAVLQRGGELPSTGAARWDPEATAGEGPDPDGTDEAASSAGLSLEERRAREREMADLTASLERAAANAVSQLKTAMEAAEDDPDADSDAEPDTTGSAQNPEDLGETSRQDAMSTSRDSDEAIERSDDAGTASGEGQGGRA